MLGCSPRIQRIAAAASCAPEGALLAGLVQELWSDCARDGTPLIEPAGSDGVVSATFVWRAPSLGWRGSVVLLANKLTDPSVYDVARLEHVVGTDVWHRTFELATTWRGSYRIAMRADEHDPVRALEPPSPDVPATVAPRRRWGVIAEHARTDSLAIRSLDLGDGLPLASVAVMPDAPPRAWSDRSAVLDVVEVPSSRGSVPRPCAVHHAGGAREAVGRPLVVLLDGERWGAQLPIGSLLDHVASLPGIGPFVALLPHSGSAAQRWRELGSDDTAFHDALEFDLVPWVQREHGAGLDPARTVLVGQSLGGLAALGALRRACTPFGAVLAQSVSLWVGRDVVPRGDGAVARVHLEVGSDEWVLRDAHHVLDRRLRAHGVESTLVEYAGGHDPACWPDGIVRGLVRLLASGGQR